jgi:predicted AlkP superfamily pyrophosphatase or phosphodiesterase
VTASRRREGRLVAAALALVVAACAHAAPDATPGQRHLVLVSIDALRPEFYLDDAAPAPTLRALRREGSHARAAEPVFPSVTYPNHATLVTGMRPARHGVLFNLKFTPMAPRNPWYEEAADLRTSPLWEWARAAQLTTAAVSWPSTVGARIDLLLPERDYYLRPDPLDVLRAAVSPGLFERLGVSPSAELFRDVARWDAFLTETAAAMLRVARPHLLLLHLVQLDYYQHREGREGPSVRPALARVDHHLATLRQALVEAGIADRTSLIVTGDHGFQDVDALVLPNELLVRAGLRGCPLDREWRATIHVAGGAAAVFVNPPGDVDAAARAEAALRAGAERFRVISRAELDDLGAMTGAVLGLEAVPGSSIGSACGRGLTATGEGGTHGFLPTRPSMSTGFIAAGPGVRAGVALDRIRLVDVAPTAARLLGLEPRPAEGRELREILR